MTRAPIFEHFLHRLFRTHFFTTPASKMVTQGAPREPPKHQNRVKLTSRAVLQKKRWKKLRKSAFSGKLDMQSAHACAVQTHFFLLALRLEKSSKKLPKSTSKSSKNHQKTLVEPFNKSCRKRWHAKRKECQKVPNKDLKSACPFRGEKSPKSFKIRDTFKVGPQASKMSPRASKITQNHENLVTQNQENPRKKTSRNGMVLP